MSAQVYDLGAIRDFRAKLMRFAEELDGALQSMRMESHRTFDWIDEDRPRYWEHESRKAYDLVNTTRTALKNCEMRGVAGHRPSCVEEKVAHQRAKQRLEHCHSQCERVKRWGLKLHHDVDEFRGRIAGVQRLLDVDIPEAIQLLTRTLTILESYAELAPPESPGE
ncbi:hypothetical protein [Planctomicrobium sp. SH664]|uniref:hypothetical protein n=1 Tax=Planctomicrobium sp. SH664 TaxID=3448125 RepID=UPI003F5BA825